MKIGRECIGYSDNDAQLFGSGLDLRAVEQLVFARNRTADGLKRDGVRTPVTRVILLTGLTTVVTKSGDEDFQAEREALQALAVLQDEAIGDAKADNSTYKPLLKVVVANAGEQAGGINTLMPKLQQLVKDDPTVLAAIVAMNSQTTTESAMKSLDELGLLVVTATLAADDIGKNLHHYLQLQTPTKVQAHLVHEYATKMLGKRKVVDFATYGEVSLKDGNQDLYVESIHDDLVDEFGEKNVTFLNWPGPFGTRLQDWCRNSFPDGIVYFGGRYKNFGGFLSALYHACQGRGNLPVLMAAGNAHRHLIGADDRTGWPTDFPLIVDANGVAASSCTAATGNHVQTTFLKRVRFTLGLCKTATAEPIGLRLGMTYDMVVVVRDAVGDLAAAGNTRPTGTAVYNQIQIDNRSGFNGVGGPFSFDSDGVVENGVDSLLCVPNIQKAYQPDVPYEIAQTYTEDRKSIRWKTCPKH